MMYRTLVAAVALTAATFVSAQVEVVDRKIPVASGGPAPAPTNNAAELHYQLQVLQQEVLQLRGLVEQQSFQIKKLKQQRLDDYLDLDRRLSQLSKSGSSGAGASSDNAKPSSVVTPQASVGSAPNEMKHYRKAMNLVLKERRYDEGAEALKKHLADFPEGRFSANVKYWLGEVYLEKKDLEQSRQWFSRVLNEHPKHNKMHDTQYKLGVVYHMLGDNVKAKEMLEQAAKSNSNAARLATSFLQANFK